MFEGSYLGDNSKIDASAMLECGICWWVYDPLTGDQTAHISCGTPFSALPAQWRCPSCDAPKHKFMVLSK
jgi:rubredoxin